MKRKRIFLVVVAMGLMIGLIGCNENKEESISDKSIEMNNEIKTSNTTEVYKSALEKQYEDYNNIKYYDNSITIKGNELISKTIIDYSKVDTKKMIEVNKENENLIVNGKVKVSALESLYKKNNISCKK